MYRYLCLLVIVSFLATLSSCDRTSDPEASSDYETEAELLRAQEELAAAQDLMERQAFEMENRSALVEKQLAEMQAALSQRENADLRESLDALTDQNEKLQEQASAARIESETLARRLEASTLLRAEPIPDSNLNVPISPSGQTGYEETIKPSLPRDYTMFYEGLSSYGRWMEIDDYGYTWQPQVASNLGWRPYRDGSWSWTEYGWAWNSNEPFGWATYHYGRWVNLNRIGWVWIPDSEWAPAWVSWRQTSDHVGWAPLPPRRDSFRGADRNCDLKYDLGPSSYTFITTNNFVSHNYTNVYAPVTQNSVIFRRSVNTTRIVPHHRHDRSHIFVQQGGPSRHQVERACRTRVSEREVHVDSRGHAPRSNGFAKSGRVDHVSRFTLPIAKAGDMSARPKIAERIGKVTPVNAFADLPQTEVAKMKKEIVRDVAKVTAMEKAAVAAVPEIVMAPDTLVAAPQDPASSDSRENAVLETPVVPSGASAEENPNTTISSAAPVSQSGGTSEAHNVVVAPAETADASPPSGGSTNTVAVTPTLPAAEMVPAESQTTSENQSTEEVDRPAVATPVEPSVASTETALPESVDGASPVGAPASGEAPVAEVAIAPRGEMPVEPSTDSNQVPSLDSVTEGTHVKAGATGEESAAEVVSTPPVAMPVEPLNDEKDIALPHAVVEVPPVETPGSEELEAVAAAVNAPPVAMPIKSAEESSEVASAGSVVATTPAELIEPSESQSTEGPNSPEPVMPIAKATEPTNSSRQTAIAKAQEEADRRAAMVQERVGAESEAANRVVMEVEKRRDGGRARAEEIGGQRAGLEAARRQAAERIRMAGESGRRQAEGQPGRGTEAVAAEVAKSQTAEQATAAENVSMEVAKQQVEEQAKTKAAAAQNAAMEAAKREAEERAKAEAVAAQSAAMETAKRQAEEQAKAEAVAAQRAAMETAKRQAEERARAEAAAAQRDAMEAARRQAEERARAEAAAAQRAAMEAARRQAEEQARRQAEERARAEAEAARRAAEEAARRQAEEQARSDASRQ